MSEQSGPITREQVERAIDQAVTGHFVIMPMHFGGDAWRGAAALGVDEDQIVKWAKALRGEA